MKGGWWEDKDMKSSQEGGLYTNRKFFGEISAPFPPSTTEKKKGKKILKKKKKFEDKKVKMKRVCCVAAS